MSYMLAATSGGSHSGGEPYNWFVNACSNMSNESLSKLTEAFTHEYGYRVVWMLSLDGEVSRRFVEFPSEAEATMFVLRWS